MHLLQDSKTLMKQSFNKSYDIEMEKIFDDFVNDTASAAKKTSSLLLEDRQDTGVDEPASEPESQPAVELDMILELDDSDSGMLSTAGGQA
eukprot:COSAG01_NODE_1256_length_11028_cov_10.728279_1_plen_90_part_10